MAARMNILDRAIFAVAPTWGERRLLARRRVEGLAAYEAAESTRLRKRARDAGSGNTIAAMSAKPMRDYARHLERNHDLFRNAINILVRNVAGPNGIGIESAPRFADGTIDEETGRQLDRLWANWCKKPEVTWRRDWASVCRLVVRRDAVDGEIMGQHVMGPGGGLDHGTQVPYSIELLEADMLPLDFHDASRRIYAGIETSGWGKPLAYHVYKTHPGDSQFSFTASTDVKRVPADRIWHVAHTDRVNQFRGISAAASVMTRLDDLMDYETSERIAAKIAASMAAYIRKGDPTQYVVNGEGANTGDRLMKFQAGMIIDDLLPGEEIGMIDSKRPNVNLVAWRDGQLRAVAGGIGVGFSSLAKAYLGNYSAQRQELIEQAMDYAVLANELICQFVRPVWEKFCFAAVSAGLVKLPAGMTMDTLTDCVFAIPQMPWVDPGKEATALQTQIEMGILAPQQAIRQRGGNPRDVLDQRKIWKQEEQERGIESAAKTETPPPVPDDPNDLQDPTPDQSDPNQDQAQ